MTIANKIIESETLAIAVENNEILNNELLIELALRTVRNLIAFRGEA
ncbi:MAG: hypothetical protein ACTSWU_00865 [Candidatus Thorarchaeota archaeon]